MLILDVGGFRFSALWDVKGLGFRVRWEIVWAGRFHSALWLSGAGGGGFGRAVWGRQGWLNGCPLVKRSLRFRGV